MYLYLPPKTPLFLNGTVFNKHFNPDGFFNGKNSWVSDDSTIKIIWDPTLTAWKLSGDSLGSTQIINTNPAYPPINANWKILGNANGYTVKAAQGACPPIVQMLYFDYEYENPSCKCDGSITLIASGGVPPYQYSYDGGVTYVSSPIKTGLCGGVYVTYVKDSMGIVAQNDSITLSEVKPETNYQLILNIDGSNTTAVNTVEYNYSFSISPPLPNGVEITVDADFTGIFTKTPHQTSANSSFTPQIMKNGVIITNYTNNTNETTSLSTVARCQNSVIYQTNYSYKYPSITITSTDVFSIKVITNYELTCNFEPPIPPTPPALFMENGFSEIGPLKWQWRSAYLDMCCRAGFSNSPVVYAGNASISGCDCCSVVVKTLSNFE